MDTLEREVSMTCVVAYALWTTTFLVILGGTVVGMAGDSEELPIALGLMAHGLALAAAAATATVRAMLVKQSRLMHNAFNLGRDAGNVRKFGSSVN